LAAGGTPARLSGTGIAETAADQCSHPHTRRRAGALRRVTEQERNMQPGQDHDFSLPAEPGGDAPQAGGETLAAYAGASVPVGPADFDPDAVWDDWDDWGEAESAAPGFAARLTKGALAGLVATVPMTVAMVVLQRFLPKYQRYPLPPEQITLKMIAEKGAISHLDDPERTIAAGILHFGIGALGGACYSVAAKVIPAPSVPRGIGFGLLVWLTGYMGWLPALGILQPATKHPAQRNALMITAHVVWGSVTGLVFAALAGDGDAGAGDDFSQAV
jgi:uncharacterized membrane protein YagU involved in acid resistance